MIVGMHHLVRERVFKVSAVAELVRAEQDAVFAIYSPRLAGVAATAADVGGRYLG